MKTLEDIYNELVKNESLKKDFVSSVKSNKLDEFFKKQDCSATKDDLASFLETKFKQSTELKDTELTSVSAGGCATEETFLSFFTVGIYCLVDTIATFVDKDGKFFYDGYICMNP